MTFRWSTLFAVTTMLGTMAVGAGGHAAPPSPTKQTLYYIPHTHWEGAVFKTREEYLEMGLPNILKALSLMKQYPNYKFVLDQVAYIRPFLERYPEEAATFRKFVAEGRLEIVGGMDVMPDVVKPGGELFVRQMQYGKLYCREQLGVDVTVAWQLDTFGHHPQMPQLLKQAGYQSFWFCRGLPNDDMPTEFFWRGIDGTQIPAFWAAGFYGLFYGPPAEPVGFSRFFVDRFNALNKHIHAPERVGLAGVDVSEPEGYVPPLVEQFNRKPDSPFTIRYSTPSEFAAVVAKRADLPVYSYDFNPIFQGTYSSRIELKQRTREIEARLLTAEKLDALAGWLGTTTSTNFLSQAWEPVLFNQTHDLASGVMTDHVYADVQRGYDFSQHLADETIAHRWTSIATHIDTRGAGIPLAVVNTLGWSRSDLAEREIGITERGVQDLKVVDSSGRAVPTQILQADRYEDGGIKQARICFIARDVPAMGYAIYHVVPEHAAPNPTAVIQEVKDRDTIENAFYRITFDRTGGAMTSLFDKTQRWEVLSGPANVVARQEDKGDLWELYHGLNGGSYIAMTDKQPVPTAGTALLSRDFKDKPGTIVQGPVFSEFHIAHPLGNGSFTTRVRLYNSLRRVDITTELVNNEKLVRYQVLFPAAVKHGHNVQEIPFGAVERPIGVEFPAQQWADYSDDKHGLALLNFGMPGNLVSEDTLILSLMRSHTIGGYGFGGGFEPGMTSDTGYELGHPLTFRYALVPHAGSWSNALIPHAGLEFNQPLLVYKVAPHAGPLPSRWGMVQILEPNVLLTAFKPGPGGTTIIRVYESSGKATKGVHIRLAATIKTAIEANLLEDSGRTLRVQQNTVQFDLHPFEIKTIKLQVSPPQRVR